MQTALFVTDCSVDSALALRNRLTATHPPIRLTVVHPYDIESGQPLNKTVLTVARGAAIARLKAWKAVLGDEQGHNLKTEILFASPELALRIHMLIRRYDAVISDGQWLVNPHELANLLAQTGTQLHYLTDNVPELVPA
ncbi:hypothetical protein [Fibrella forsythiae]|uniref:Universal stress protein n=1 Tax=Fibrella forsythiae TaxID=2817061 RepID=A0ABS3JQT2_9BACT|nr:hypothetical protein [Fibrella forsythiae]MBO0951808.1 hypothetical protein [Fibrella forsythiae]